MKIKTKLRLGLLVFLLGLKLMELTELSWLWITVPIWFWPIEAIQFIQGFCSTFPEAFDKARRQSKTPR